MSCHASDASMMHPCTSGGHVKVFSFVMHVKDCKRSATSRLHATSCCGILEALRDSFAPWIEANVPMEVVIASKELKHS